ncbi:TetR family transcriptional regulator [Nocardioides aequoreus]|uniref:TetR family transcriptional regulator n=1 Tax=Nocardioides aequoreus TaxID=397278 RepID=UPI0004C31CDD|nr:TetR family transcriptional regulator [Nocardioides aequoreus]
MRPLLAPVSQRERLLTAAAGFTAEHGWSALTMAKLADLVGVSRQTVYNEIGGKPQLAEAMVMRELELFLGKVEAAFADNPADLVAAIRAAAVSVLELADTDPLLHAVLSSTQGADSDLLPLLTTHSEMLLTAAGEVVGEHVRAYDVPLPPDRLQVLIDMVIRLVLSHVMQPSGTPEETAATIAWISAKVLDRES